MRRLLALALLLVALPAVTHAQSDYFRPATTGAPAAIPAPYSAGPYGSTPFTPAPAPAPVLRPPVAAPPTEPPSTLGSIWQKMPWSSPPQTPHPAVVRIVVPERGAMSLGSGSLVEVNEKYGLVLTNWHVVRDAAGPIRVIFPDGFESPGTLAKSDRDWDLAALIVWRPRVAPVRVATEPPRPGETLTIAGYGGGSYLAQTGRCTQYLSPGRALPYEVIEVSARARQGDSGGPILNSRGELAGVLFGEGGGNTSGTYCGRASLFVASITGGRGMMGVGNAALAQQRAPMTGGFASTAPMVAAPLAQALNAPATTTPGWPPAVTQGANPPVASDRFAYARGSVGNPNQVVRPPLVAVAPLPAQYARRDSSAPRMLEGAGRFDGFAANSGNGGFGDGGSSRKNPFGTVSDTRGRTESFAPPARINPTVAEETVTPLDNTPAWLRWIGTTWSQRALTGGAGVSVLGVVWRWLSRRKKKKKGSDGKKSKSSSGESSRKAA